MHVEPSKKSFRPSRPNDTEPSEEQANFANKNITTLPDELLVKIFSNLDTGDLTHCQLVNRRWQELIDDRMLALPFYRRCHPTERRINPLTVERYHSSIQGWLRGFSNLGKESAAQLDKFLQHKHFTERLFFSIAKVLAKAEALTCQDVGTITHSDWVCNTSFSPDGDNLVTSSVDGTAKIWKLVNGQWQEKTTIQHSAWVKDLCFSPDGKRLVTGSLSAAKIWELVGDQWQEETTIQHSDWVKDLCFSPDGKRLVTGSLSAAKIWELVGDQWQEETTIQHTGWVNEVCFSPDGRQLVTASKKAAKIWELVGDQWQEKATLRHAKRVVRACFSPDGNHLAIAYQNNTAKIWGLSAGEWGEEVAIEYYEYGIEGKTIRYSGWVKDVCFSPHGNYLAIAAADTPTIWKLVDGEWEQSAAIEHSGLVSKVSFSPDGNHLLIVSDEPTIKIWGGVDGRWQEKATIARNFSFSSFSPDGHHLVTASDNNAKIWVLKSKENADSC